MPELTVSTDLPAGNACVLEIRPDARPPEIHFTPSPVGGPEAMWFCFRVDLDKDPAPAGIRCVMHLADCLLGGGSKEFNPVYRSGQGEWTRVADVESEELSDGRPLVSWHVPGDEGSVEVALCYPYGMRELDDLAEALGEAFRRDTIGVTMRHNRLLRFGNDPGAAEPIRPGVYCLARQHAGETPGSWALDGFLRRMAAAGPDAPLVWAAPFVNVDGVLAGHYGKDSFPCDFNRAWGSKLFPQDLHDEMTTHPMRYEVLCLQRDMVRWSKRCRGALVLDFHAPGMCSTDGIYAYLRDVDDQGRPDERHGPWVQAFHNALGDDLAAAGFARSGRYPSRWNQARVGDFANRALDMPHITFEVPYARLSKRIYTVEDYRMAGSRIAEAVLGRLAVEGVREPET